MQKLDYGHHEASDEATLDELEKILRQYMPKRSLDLGCGQGYAMLSMALHVDHVYGVDYSCQMIPLADTVAMAFTLLHQIGAKPQLMRHNYRKAEFWSTPFNDGVTPSEIKFLYCHTYHAKHARDTVADITAHLQNDTLLALTDEISHGMFGLALEKKGKINVYRKVGAAMEPYLFTVLGIEVG